MVQNYLNSDQAKLQESASLLSFKDKNCDAHGTLDLVLHLQNFRFLEPKLERIYFAIEDVFAGKTVIVKKAKLRDLTIVERTDLFFTIQTELTLQKWSPSYSDLVVY